MALYSSHTDEQLLASLKGGDAEAFTELYNRYWKLLFYVAFKRLAEFSEAEETVQDIFTDIWARRQTLQITRSVKYYLSAAAQYQVMKQLAKRNKITLSLSLSPSEEGAPADQSLLFRELELQIQAVVDTLPEKCRLIYTMSRDEGMNNKEIAARLEIAEKTVENHLTKALSRIKDGLGNTAYLFAISQVKDLF